MAEPNVKHIFMMAGEASGDALGASAISALQSGGEAYEITGVGGALMLGLGLNPVVDMSEFNVFGFSQSIKAYKRLKQRARELIAHIMATRPELVVMIDNKGFSKRFGKMLKAEMAAACWTAPIVQLVAPTVWAWGPWRAKAMNKSADHVLCLFPFEPPYFTPYGIDAVAVGHPSLDHFRPEKKDARQSLGLDPSDQVLVILPGSRPREVEKLLPQMLKAGEMLRQNSPNLRVILPAAEQVGAQIRGIAGDVPWITIYGQDQTNTVMSAGDYGLICSGTVSLEAALCGLHGHVYYHVDPVTTLIGRFLMDRSKIVLPNAVSGEVIYEVSLNKDVTVEHMVKTADAFFKTKTEPKPIKTRLIKSLTAGDGDFGQNTAAALRRILNGR